MLLLTISILLLKMGSSQAQTQSSLVGELRQDYDELMDVMYSSGENSNFKSEISQYGANIDDGWNALEVLFVCIIFILRMFFMVVRR